MTLRPSTLPREYYTSEAIYREEIERLFNERWLCIGRADEIAEAGDFRVQTVGEESLLILRGQDGVARAFYNVCRHRGSQLCTSDSGRMPGAITCPYHAWTYSLEGKLRGAPHMREVAGFDAAEFGLHPAALETWEGFLFLSLAQDPAPLATEFAPFAEHLRRWGLPGLRLGRRMEYEVRANWKLIVENFSDCYHCRLVHPELNALSDYRSGENDFVAGDFLGGYMTMIRSGTSLTMSGDPCGPILEGIGEEDRDRVYYYSLFPNLLLGLHPEYVLALRVRPLAADRTQVVCEWLFDPAALSQPEYDPEDAIAFWDRTNRQDWAVCERTQKGVSSRVYTPEPACGTHEDLVVAFDREVLKALGRLDE